MMKNEEQKDEVVDLQQATKNLVLSELEKNGVIAYMRAKIKKSVIDIIDQQKDSTKQKIDFDYITPLHRQNKSREIVLICHLIKEFLHFYEMEYTFPIFENESNIKETVKRETLLKEFSLTESKDDPKPVLLHLIEDIKGKNKQLDDLLRNTAKNAVNTFGGGFGSLNQFATNDDALKSKPTEDNYTIPIIPNKKQLSPISYVNKSVEMNSSGTDKSSEENQKFNTLNINEVYKQDNPKELTVDDILNKPKPKPIDPLEGHEATGNKLSIDYYNTNGNKYDDEFQEMILEEITPNKKDDDNDESKKSGSLNSLGYDQSVPNYNLNEFDYVESAEKP